jgi:hypothetical protein
MSKHHKIKIDKSRIVHTYAELWHASECVLNTGIQNSILELKGSNWQFLSSILLTAFAFEAYLNHIGPHAFTCWCEYERYAPLQKLDLLCIKLEVSCLKCERPIQTIKKLFDFRNTMAHGQSETLKPNPIMKTKEEYEESPESFDETLFSKWEDLIQNEKFACFVREDVKIVLERLHEARIDDNKEPLFTFGMSITDITFIENS